MEGNNYFMKKNIEKDQKQPSKKKNDKYLGSDISKLGAKMKNVYFTWSPRGGNFLRNY
jgi:hypothetical protein